MSNRHELPDWTENLFSSSPDECEDVSDEEVTIEFTPEAADDEDEEPEEETTWEWNGSVWRQVN